MKSVVTELNYNLNSYTESIKESRLDQVFSSIEPVESFETENQFYFLARLSQTKYYDFIEESRRNAITTAIRYLEKADSEYSISSFTNLGNAWLEVKDIL